MYLNLSYFESSLNSIWKCLNFLFLFFYLEPKNLGLNLKRFLQPKFYVSPNSPWQPILFYFDSLHASPSVTQLTRPFGPSLPVRPSLGKVSCRLDSLKRPNPRSLPPQTAAATTDSSHRWTEHHQLASLLRASSWTEPPRFATPVPLPPFPRLVPLRLHGQLDSRGWLTSCHPRPYIRGHHPHRSILLHLLAPPLLLHAPNTATMRSSCHRLHSLLTGIVSSPCRNPSLRWGSPMAHPPFWALMIIKHAPKSACARAPASALPVAIEECMVDCHTPFRERGNEASIRVPRMFKSHAWQQYDNQMQCYK
jgi:hypothetical protein